MLFCSVGSRILTITRGEKNHKTMPSKERIREREARELASQFSISGSWKILNGYCVKSEQKPKGLPNDQNSRKVNTVKSKIIFFSKEYYQKCYLEQHFIRK